MQENVGGNLALEFANSAGFHALGDRREGLPDLDHLLEWCRNAGLITAHERRQILGQIEESGGGETLAGEARSLRDSIQSIFSRIARKRPPSPSDLSLLNEAIARTYPHRRIGGRRDRFEWEWERSTDPQRILWPVICAAADLLVSPEISRLRECSGRDCSRLFLDQSRNGSRRWCTMTGCGNRAKARRHYRREKG
ncbi:MAG: ABATE domain-containing protein [Thermoanaerobaculia bacterium]